MVGGGLGRLRSGIGFAAGLLVWSGRWPGTVCLDQVEPGLAEFGEEFLDPVLLRGVVLAELGCLALFSAQDSDEAVAVRGQFGPDGGEQSIACAEQSGAARADGSVAGQAPVDTPSRRARHASARP
ncbi:hypothetical protein ACIRVF_42795 [Kitasatospora sp. NPDC101157]|uniref:hypothetical protein n=1 Tax=Kitasatospora sp. NPDC101157 TaxID=3364098 RepID=UPI003807A596